MSRFLKKVTVPVLMLLAACSGEDLSDQPRPQASMLQAPSLPGSFGPRLSPTPDGAMVLSWLEPRVEGGHALRYSILNGSSWGPSALVASGEQWFANWADFPSVVPVSDTLWGAHWLVRREAGGYAYDIHAAISVDAGRTWSEPFLPHTDDTDTEHGFVSMFAAGDRIGMVWLDGRKYVNEVTDDVEASAMTLRSATFGPDRVAANEVLVDGLICDCCQTDVAMTLDGPVAVYRDRTENEIRDIFVARQLDGQWQDGYAVSHDNWEIHGCPVNGPVIEADGDQVAVAWFTAANDNARVQAAWSNDSGRTFGAPIEVSGNKPLGHVGSALLDNGDLVVSWQRRIENGGTELNLRRVSANGETGEIHVLPETAGIFAMSVPQIARLSDDLVLAWTVEADNAYSIRTAIVPVRYLD